jgi:hypothetical protein
LVRGLRVHVRDVGMECLRGLHRHPPASPRAFSSVGESARLITVRSLVRIQKGPRSEPARLLRHHLGDVAQLGEHLLCKQGVAGSSPAISTARFERHPIGRKTGTYRTLITE